MAPELVKHVNYNEKVDVWGLGIITYQLLSGKMPFDGNNIKKINSNILNRDVKFPKKQWDTISDSAKDFIEQCLDKDQNTRPTVADLFGHEWILEMQTEES